MPLVEQVLKYATHAENSKNYSKKINHKYIKNLTYNPSYNIKLGTFYFKEMLNKFNGSYVLALRLMLAQ